jgi:glycosyltransferase involved in cell wall biosynthesis
MWQHRAHVVLVPSAREGWGLVVVEANAMATPVVGYNVPGLRDSIIHNETGILSTDSSPRSLAEEATSMLQDRGLLNNYSKNALIHSGKFSWDKSAEMFEKVISTLTDSTT